MRKLLFDISHTTTYEYLGDVSISHHLLRLGPRDYSRQSCLSHELAIAPGPATMSVRRDYFGNLAHFVGLETPHKQLVITSHSRVALGPVFIPEPAETPSWEIVRAGCRDDHSGQALEAHEFTYPSPLVPVAEEFAAYAQPSFAPRRPVLEAVADLTRRISQDFAFDPAATTVTTPVADVLQQRRGVCQDLAHVQIACLRAYGLPARYVSGYLETNPPPGQPKLLGVDASHAWVGFFCPGLGWVDVDPTNNCFPSMRHITVGWGRDYSDVCPIRGVLMGGEGQTLRVAVDVNAVGPVEEDAGAEQE
jgi:transglutaminase-like putative cysteine protease